MCLRSPKLFEILNRRLFRIECNISAFVVMFGYQSAFGCQSREHSVLQFLWQFATHCLFCARPNQRKAATTSRICVCVRKRPLNRAEVAKKDSAQDVALGKVLFYPSPLANGLKAKLTLPRISSHFFDMPHGI